MNDGEYLVNQVRISVREAGNSQYRVKLVARDLNGLNPRTLVETNLTFTDARQVVMLPVLDAQVEQHNTIELSLFELVVGDTPAKDLTVTLIGEDFTYFLPQRQGHIIKQVNQVAVPQRTNLEFKNAKVTDDVVNDKSVVDFTPFFAIPALDVDWEAGTVQNFDITANSALTFSNSSSGQTIIVVVNNATGSNWQVTFPAGVKSPSGVLTSTVNNLTANVYTFVNAGGVIYATSVDLMS